MRGAATNHPARRPGAAPSAYIEKASDGAVRFTCTLERAPHTLLGRRGPPAASVPSACYRSPAVLSRLFVIPVVCPRCSEPMLRLTPRRTEILEALLEGLSNKEIALCRNISLGTVRTVLAVLYRETSTTSRTQLAVWYLRMRDRHSNLEAA